MKFIKGIIVGSMVSTGIVMMYKGKISRKIKPIRKSKRIMKKIGII